MTENTTSTSTSTLKPIANDAIALACQLIAQAQGDVGKARRAFADALVWMQRVDPTFKAEFIADQPAALVDGETAQEWKARAERIKATLDEVRHQRDQERKIFNVVKDERDGAINRLDNLCREHALLVGQHGDLSAKARQIAAERDEALRTLQQTTTALADEQDRAAEVIVTLDGDDGATITATVPEAVVAKVAAEVAGPQIDGVPVPADLAHLINAPTMLRWAMTKRGLLR